MRGTVFVPLLIDANAHSRFYAFVDLRDCACVCLYTNADAILRFSAFVVDGRL